MLVVEKPTRNKALMYRAINRELKDRCEGKLSEEECNLITAGFVNSLDYSNSAQMHRSAGSWAEMILDILDKQKKQAQ